MSQLITMYDDVTASLIPASATAVAGYVDGNYVNYESLVAGWPHAHHLSIAVQLGSRARAGDFENGDMTIADASQFLLNYAEPDPVFYTPASQMGDLITIVLNTYKAHPGLEKEKGKPYFWSAHTGKGKHICGPHTCGYAQANGTQWDWTALGRNLDESLCEGWLFQAAKPADPHHYGWFMKDAIRVNNLYLSELQTVKGYDAARKHPRKNATRLKVLEAHCKILRDRISRVAHNEGKPGHPQWNIAHRGWRWQQFHHRYQGKQVVK